MGAAFPVGFFGVVSWSVQEGSVLRCAPDLGVEGAPAVGIVALPLYLHVLALGTGGASGLGRFGGRADGAVLFFERRTGFG